MLAQCRYDLSSFSGVNTLAISDSAINTFLSPSCSVLSLMYVSNVVKYVSSGDDGVDDGVGSLSDGGFGGGTSCLLELEAAVASVCVFSFLRHSCGVGRVALSTFEVFCADCGAALAVGAASSVGGAGGLGGIMLPRICTAMSMYSKCPPCLHSAHAPHKLPQ